MDFLRKIFDAVARGAEKASVVDFKIFAIIAISLIVALGIGIAISYAFSGIAKLRFATKKISKLIQNKYKIIDDENVAAFTKECFSEQAPRRLREAWIQYLGVRFGYPSDIISREKVFDREVGSNRNIRSVVFIAISFLIVGILSFFCMGSAYKEKLGIVAGVAIILVAVIHLLFVLAAKIEYKRALKAFETMQDDLDAATQLQIEKDYAADSSPLSDIASIVDEIIAKNISKDVQEREYAVEPAAPIDILLKFNQELNQEQAPAPVEKVEEVQEEPQIEEVQEEPIVEETPLEQLKIEEIVEEKEEEKVEEPAPIEEPVIVEEVEEKVEEVIEEPQVVELQIEEEPVVEQQVEENEVMTNEEPSDIISNVDEIISSVNEDDNSTLNAVLASAALAIKSLPERERQVPSINSEEDLSIEKIGNAFRDGYKDEQYIKQLDEQIIKEDEDMFGFKKKNKKAKEEIAQEEVVEVESTNEFDNDERVDLDINPEQVTDPNLGFDYGEAQALQDAEAGKAPVEEAPAEEAPIDEVPTEEAPAEETPVEEAPVEEKPAEEEVIAAAEELADEDLEEIPEPSEDDVKAVEMMEAEEAAIDDSDEFTPPRFAKLPQLVNFMCSSSKVSKNVKIKMCIFLLQAFKSFKDQPEEKNIILTCLLKILVSIKMAK